jgi:trk system potassium uptake protein TrkH
MHNAWFQSVTTRTAGFNSVDIAALRPATIWIMTALMFIGGSPGGTAGGVKTTTLAVLLVAVRCAMRGRWEAVTMGRRLTDATVYKAAALITLAGLAVVVAMVALQVTQSLPFDASLFEAVSALATVGLSMGATAMLDDVGKVIVAVCMFVGRVGPLTLFFFLRERDSHRPWRLPASDVEVG